MTVTCRVCGSDSERIYRCEECGKDLVDETETDTDLVTDGGQPQSVDELAERAVHPDELDVDLATLLVRTDFDEYPYRHPDRLTRAWADAASITALANEFEGIPDTDAGRQCLQDWGETASDYATQELAGETVQIQFDAAADRRGTFDCLLAYVLVDGENFNYDHVATGHARVFDSTFSQSARFYDAEADAQDARTGLWDCRDHETQTPTDPGGDSDLVVATITADAPGNDHENLNGEYIVFRNAGETPLDLTGWTVADEADHTYQFPTGFTLAPGAEVTLYTGSGSNTDSELYWGSGGAI